MLILELASESLFDGLMWYALVELFEVGFPEPLELWMPSEHLTHTLDPEMKSLALYTRERVIY